MKQLIMPNQLRAAMNLLRLTLALVSLVVLPCALGATTYYVSATGSDANSGTHNAFAWKTTSKVNNTAMAIGNDVLFKCGDTWIMGGSNPSLAVDWNGTSTDPVIIGAYYLDTDGVTEIRGVQGAKPEFDGNSAYPTTGEYASLVLVYKRQHVIVENLHVRRSLARGLHITGNKLNDHVQLLNLDVEHTYSEGIVFYDLDYGLVEGCTISYSGERRLVTGDDAPGFSSNRDNTRLVVRKNAIHEIHGNGITFTTNSSQCTIENNVVYNCRSGYSITLGNGASDCDVRGNIVYGTTTTSFWAYNGKPSSGILVVDWVSTYDHQRNRIYNNLIANCNTGIFAQSDVRMIDTFIYSNTLVDNLINIELKGPFTNCAVRNNIIWSITPGDSIPITLTNYSSNLSLSHNYWSLTPTASAKGTGDVYGGVPLLYKTTGWRSIAPGGLSAADCEIAASSPGFNAGADLSATYAMDITGTARPRLQGWDMGAWERVSDNQMEHLSLTAVPFNLLYTETATNLVMQLDCQAKNYDVLVSLRIANSGSAVAARDLTHLRLWHLSGGAGLPFNPSQAVVIGTFSPISDSSWMISTALTLQDHDTLYVTADIPSGAKGGNTVQFSLPANGAVFQYSRPLELTGLLNPYVQAIRSAILLTLDTEPLGTVNLLQGQAHAPLGRVWLKNVSGDMLNLVSLKLTLQAKSGLPKDPGQCFNRMQLLHNSSVIATANPPFPLGAFFSLSPAIALVNQERVALDVYADVLAEPELEGFRLLVANAAAVNSGQIQSSPVEGKLFPLTVADANIRPPSAEAVFSSFPNPFKPSSGPMRVAYYLESAGEAELSVWTLSGRRVATLEQADKPAGLYEISWDGKNEQGRAVVSGPYLLRLELRYADAPSQRFSRKFVVAR